MRIISQSIFIIFLITNILSSSTNKANILIVYFSLTGHTQIMAEAVMEGASKNENVNVKILSVEDAKISDVIESDAIIIGSPVYNANTSPEIQKFINKWPFKDSPMKDKVGAAFVTAGGISAGEEIVLMNILKSMLIFGMVVVGGENWQSAFGASAVVNEAPFDEDKNINEIFLVKARSLGERVADITLKMKE